MDRGMTDIHYIGKDKPEGWYEREQNKFLEDRGFNDEYFCWLYLEWFTNEIERERKERDN